jgi:hypothetical protein
VILSGKAYNMYTAKMNKPQPLITLILSTVGAVFAMCHFVSCGTIVTSSDSPNGSNANRRLYVNDAAANDSLTSAIVMQGVRFVLQPGKNYAITLESNEKSDQISLFRYDTRGGLEKVREYTPDLQGTQEVFFLKSTQTQASVFMAQLLPPDGELAIKRFKSVKLISLETAQASTLKLKLIFAGDLKNLNNDASKASFAKALFAEMNAIFVPYGLSVVGKYEVADPQGAARIVPFGGTFASLPGTREAGYVHLYLVDSIAPPASAKLEGGYILGFAPREAPDLSLQPESRVILSNRYFQISGLATTGAHEIGHFFGLRHTTATQIDMGFDQDLSNVDDGLATSSCDGLAKKAWSPKTSSFWDLEMKADNGMVYCLRISGVAESCPGTCFLPNPQKNPLNNLMFAYDCSTSDNPQRNLTSDQIQLWKKNLNLLQ